MFYRITNTWTPAGEFGLKLLYFVCNLNNGKGSKSQKPAGLNWNSATVVIYLSWLVDLICQLASWLANRTLSKHIYFINIFVLAEFYFLIYNLKMFPNGYWYKKYIFFSGHEHIKLSYLTSWLDICQLASKLACSLILGSITIKIKCEPQL